MQLDEALTLSAQHLRAATVTVDEQTTALILSDGEDVVAISHEIGRPELAAARLAEAGRAMVAYAEQIRRGGRAQVEVLQNRDLPEPAPPLLGLSDTIN